MADISLCICVFLYLWYTLVKELAQRGSRLEESCTMAEISDELSPHLLLCFLLLSSTFYTFYFPLFPVSSPLFPVSSPLFPPLIAHILYLLFSSVSCFSSSVSSVFSFCSCFISSLFPLLSLLSSRTLFHQFSLFPPLFTTFWYTSTFIIRTCICHLIRTQFGGETGVHV